MSKTFPKIFSIIILILIQITNQDEVIGFYQDFNIGSGIGGESYEWKRCYKYCYTCNKNISDDLINQNCLSCNSKEGRYLLEDDLNQNCYIKDELPNINSPTLNNKAYILDTKQTPNKWVTCNENCKTCSDKATQDRMNCIECKENHIQVNTFCFPIDPDDNDLGFFVDGVTGTRYCGEYKDDETSQQLGIFEGDNKCIIKPESSYFPQKNEKRLLRNCGNNCIACEGVLGDDEKSDCLKCQENYVKYKDSTECKCPKYYGIEDPTTNNCVNCKYSPKGPYNLNGNCVDKLEHDGESYHLINTTYNIISKCKRPCLECDANGKCLSCAPNYYFNNIAFTKSTITDITKLNEEICLTYKECLFLGIKAYVDFSECSFCNEEHKYKLYNELSCEHYLPSIDGYYYLKDENYNALGKCHEKCEKCLGMPKGDNFQNCETCIEGYTLNEDTNNCELTVVEEEEMEEEEEEEEEIKCKDVLFYIDTEEEDEENKIKCIQGNQLCPNEYQYLIKEERMCVKDNKYEIEHETTRTGVRYVKNIEYDYSIDYEEYELVKFIIISNGEIVHFSKNLSYLNDYWKYFNEKIISRESVGGRDFNYVFNGGDYKYLNSEDSTFHFTTTVLQRNFISYETRRIKNNAFSYFAKSNDNIITNSYSNTFLNNHDYETYRNKRKVSMIYLSECEEIIKIILGINSDTPLKIMKLDIYPNITNNEIGTNKVEYRVYHPNTRNPIDLWMCKNYAINIITPVSISSDINSESYKLYKILLNVKKEGYEPFIVYSDFYTKICEQYKSEYDTDMNTKDRKKYIYDKIKKFNFCQKDCYYRSTDDDIYYINCICLPKNVNDEDENFDITNLDFTTLEENNEENYKNVDYNKDLNDINKNKVNDYFNFYLMKCFKLLFSYDGFFYNYISMIIMGLYILFLILIFFYSCIGFDFYINLLKEMLFHKYLYREYWRIKKIEEEINIEENNISFEEEISRKKIDIINTKIQNRTNTKNVFERTKKFKPTDDNKWIRLNKSSTLVDPLKDDQIQQINEYSYKNNELYQNKTIKIRDYQNDTNINNNAPPKRIDKKNNNYYHMEKNNDLINARTVKPITSHNYDDIQAIIKGKQKSETLSEINSEKNSSKNNININDKNLISKEDNNDNNNTIEEVDTQKENETEIKNKETEKDINIDKDNDDNINKDKENEQVTQQENDINNNINFNKKSEAHNTSPAIYIYNLILGDIPQELIDEEKEEVLDSKIITKREYSFLNDGEINELDYDNSLFHDKRNIIRIYYSFLKYNCILIFSFFVYEDFNLMLVKYALFIFYSLLYLTFNTVFFNNNTIHNIYINEGDYVINYHWWKIFLAFILSIIFIKLIKWWITFYRRKSLSMKLLKRYTDAKNEILRMIEQYHFHLKIFFPISCALFIFFWYYISTVFAVFRYSFWYLLINWAICAVFHVAYSIVLNIIPTVMRYLSLKKEGREYLYKASRIVSYFF